jgi:hypothetical protein
MKNLIKNFWNGNISLWKSYWIIGELLNAVFVLLIFNIEINIFDNGRPISTLPFLNFSEFNFFNKILLIFWSLFISIGIWRSAEKYKGPFLWIILTLIFLSYRIFSLGMALY